MKLFSYRDVFKKSFWVVYRDQFYWVDSLIGKSNGRGKFVSITVTVGIWLFENRFLVLEPYSWVFRFIWPSSIAIHLSVIVQSENHWFQVITVNISLHNRISSGFKFSLYKIPISLDISFKLVCIIFCILHNWQWCIGILLDFDLLEHFDFSLIV